MPKKEVKLNAAEMTKSLAMIAIMFMAGYIAVVGVMAASQGVSAQFESTPLIGILFTAAGLLGASEVAFEKKNKKLSISEIIQLVVVCAPATLLGLGNLMIWINLSAGQVLVNLFSSFTWVIAGLIFLLMAWELFVDKD